MAETKFTPGPWKTRASNATGMVEIVAATARGLAKVVCRLGGFFRNKDANAHLIAAAPEMYAELDRVAKWLSTQSGDVPRFYVDVIHALLSKARGEA